MRLTPEQVEFLNINKAMIDSLAPSPSLVGLPLEWRTLRLINATAHVQDPQTWEAKGVEWINPDQPIWKEISPALPLREQVLAAWTKLLAIMDAALTARRDFNGVALGGYAPLVAPFFKLLSNARHATFVFVQGPSEMVDGKRKPPVMAGVRMIPPSRAFVPKDGRIKAPAVRFDRMVWVGSRALTPDRESAIKSFHPASLVAFNPPNPPLLGASLSEWQEQVDEIVAFARQERIPILVDGCAAETLLRITAQAEALSIPLFFPRTQVVDPAALPVLVGIDEMPSF